MRREAVRQDLRVGDQLPKPWVNPSRFLKSRAVPNEMAGGSSCLVAKRADVGVRLFGFVGPDRIPKIVR